MKLEVKRTSIWGDEKPCENATQAMVPHYDTRSCSESDYDNRVRILSHGSDAKRWSEYGTEHTVKPNGHIIRRVEDKKVWVIDINSIDDLFNFVDANGDCVISKDRSIEIYDDYRE